ncbi:MAG: hypothetical protein MJ083_03280 [Clostridia bacterium]|nr:hypothetical protein [Clostridia bacterium]
MTNKSSSRDKIMMGVLALVVVAALWYLLFFTPNKARIEELRGSEEGGPGLIQMTKDENAGVVEDINVLKGWMEDLGLSIEDADDEEKITNFTKIADYNNLVQLTDEINQILGVTETFSLNFSTPTRGENCWRRDIAVTFKTASREDAYDVLRRFNEMEHGCLISNITFSITQGDVGAQSASVSCGISIFEYEKTEVVAEVVY